MALIVVLANYCSLIGTALAAIIAYRQQRAIRAVLILARSDDPEDREIAQFLETEHRGFFLGMTQRQLRVFWFAIGMAVFGQVLFAGAATVQFVDARTSLLGTLAGTLAKL